MMKNDWEENKKDRPITCDETVSSEVNTTSNVSCSRKSSGRRVSAAFFIVPFFVVLLWASLFLYDRLRETRLWGDSPISRMTLEEVSPTPADPQETDVNAVSADSEVNFQNSDDVNVDSEAESLEPAETNDSSSDEESEPEVPDVPSEEQETNSSPTESITTEQDDVDVQVNEEEKRQELELLEQARQELTQLNYDFSSLKQQDERDVDLLEERLAPLVEGAEKLSENAPEEIAERSKKLLEELRAFQRCIESNSEFLNELYALDQASLTIEETRKFFEPYRNQAPSSEFSEIDAYLQDFVNVSKTLDALDATKRWNDFVLRNGDALERFYVQPEVAKSALHYLSQNLSSPGRPRECLALERRKAEWEFDVEALVAVQRKVLLKLEAEISQRYWTYAPTADRCYYLPDRPRLGKNEYVANQDGTTQIVEIPETALELQSSESVQTDFLRSLAVRARLIPDELRTEDVAQWYEKWCSFLSELQETKKLDAIVKYVLLRDVVDILASSDYYFARRLEPLQRMLVTSQIDDVVIDRFQTESPELQKLRRLVNSKIDFLPKDYLKVDKTTAQLDAQVERVAFSYQRIGWLDRDFSGVWQCRYLKERELPVGELFILRQEENTNVLQWLKIGESNGRQVSLKLASSNAPRGSIVFCRVRLSEQKQVAKRNGLEQYFRR